MANSPRVIRSPEPKVSAVFPFVILASLRALIAPLALSGTSLKPESDAFLVSSPRTSANNTAASTRLIGSCVPNVLVVYPLLLLKQGNQQPPYIDRLHP